MNRTASTPCIAVAVQPATGKDSGTYSIGAVLVGKGDSTPAPVGDGSALREALTTHLENDLPLVSHSVPEARAALEQELSLTVPESKFYSTRIMARILYPAFQDYTLDALTESLSITPPPGKAAVDDAALTALLWHNIMHRAHSLHPAVLAALRKIFTHHRSHAAARFMQLLPTPLNQQDASLTTLFPAVSLPAPRRDLPDPETYSIIDPDSIEEVLGAGGTIARHLPQYEDRPEQLQMASTIMGSFNRGTHLLVEAGTGIGKSLAYLVPAALWSKYSQTPVIISTNTKNLQTQLFEKDLPLLQQALGEEINAALIKGRANYLCVRKLLTLVRNAGSELERKQFTDAAAMIIWASETRTGDFAEAGVDASDSRMSSTMLSSTREECRGRACPHRRTCFLQRARRYAQAADVVVANHAVVFGELSIGNSLSPVLPPYRHAIFDEAHNIEDSATRLLSVELSLPKLRFILRNLSRRRRRRYTGALEGLRRQLASGTFGGAEDTIDAAITRVEDLQEGVSILDANAEHFFAELAILLGPKRTNLTLDPADRSLNKWEPVEATRQRFESILRALADGLDKVSDTLDTELDAALFSQLDIVKDLTAGAIQLREYAQDMGRVLCSDPDDGVAWLERCPPQAGGVRGWLAPLDVGGMLHSLLYSQKESIILTSATLTVRNNMDFIKTRLGLNRCEPERISEQCLGTPFDFQQQCLAVVPSFLPDPVDGDAYADSLGDLLANVFKATGGRGMALFTSYAMLRATVKSMTPALADHDIRVLAQGESGSRDHITSIFKHDIRSVLAGTHSFWEGVDIAGESLSCLALARLPFAVFTDPVVEARCRVIEEAGGNAFIDYSLPSAVIKFRQGYGRLIRHRTDRGVIIVTDRRIITKRYGSWFRNSLPVPLRTAATQDECLALVSAFFDSDN